MLILLSPSKTLDFNPSPAPAAPTEPRHLDQARLLIDTVRALDAEGIAALMDLSPALAALNAGRFARFDADDNSARPALLAFKGDVYKNWSLKDWDEADFAFAQDHLRILSGLYGVLRPLDLIRPYRLEMGTGLPNARGGDLYAFWGGHIRATLEDDLAAQGDDLLVNLASAEYFKAADARNLRGRVIQPAFKEDRGGAVKTIALFAKRARGLMAQHLLKNRIADLDGLRAFDLDGYRLDPGASTDEAPVFVRKH